MPDADTPRDAADVRSERDVRDAGSHAGAATTSRPAGRSTGRVEHPAADEQPIDLLQYVRRLVRFLVPGAVLGLLTALVVALALGHSVPKVTYHTKAHVMMQPNVSNEAIATTQSQLSSQYMRTYIALETSPLITNEVVQALHGKYTQQQINEMMQFYWGGGSLVLAVQATSTDHQDALDISEAGAKALVAHQNELLSLPKNQAPHLALVEDAFDDTPATTGGGSHLDGIKPGIAAGLAVTVIAAVVLEWLSSRRNRRRHGVAVARTSN